MSHVTTHWALDIGLRPLQRSPTTGIKQWDLFSTQIHIQSASALLASPGRKYNAVGYQSWYAPLASQYPICAPVLHVNAQRHLQTTAAQQAAAHVGGNNSKFARPMAGVLAASCAAQTAASTAR
eukprot:GHUV01013785.1.p1 GENE.GHUV01013785.1~~GHUV01013785.1.p1  ORF type:complete len:124 (+),score=29.69 GHUV01013785.1:123-494(+)